MGFRVAFWASGFFVVEEAVDRLRGGLGGEEDRGAGMKEGKGKDFGSSVVAGLGVAGGFAAWHRFPMVVAARTARVGLLGGLGFGVLQDGVGWARGRRVGWVDFLVGRGRRGGEKEGAGGRLVV